MLSNLICACLVFVVEVWVEVDFLLKRQRLVFSWVVVRFHSVLVLRREPKLLSLAQLLPNLRWQKLRNVIFTLVHRVRD
jgi:type IV secretory pathway TrbD component